MIEQHLSLLEIKNLNLQFKTRSGIVHALEGINLEIKKGELVGVVGESGSGKSVMAYAAMGILDAAAHITSGEIFFGGFNMVTGSESDLEEIRGREMSMVFQNPRTALNPIRKVGKQIEDVLLRHADVRHEDLRDKAIAALKGVNIPDPEKRYHAYPFELSGGMCQRVMIALALACSPSLLIADEPTTGIDVTTQATIMDLIRDLAKQRHMATMLITHDLGLAAEYCQRIIVMHAGHVVESAPTNILFDTPRHPYTAQLIKATPRKSNELDQLSSIAGNLPDLRRSDLPACRFSERCQYRTNDCSITPLKTIKTEMHTVSCWNPI